MLLSLPNLETPENVWGNPLYKLPFEIEIHQCDVAGSAHGIRIKGVLVLAGGAS